MAASQIDRLRRGVDAGATRERRHAERTATRKIFRGGRACRRRSTPRSSPSTTLLARCGRLRRLRRLRALDSRGESSKRRSVPSRKALDTGEGQSHPPIAITQPGAGHPLERASGPSVSRHQVSAAACAASVHRRLLRSGAEAGR